jgi:hypothetical protein
MKFGKLLQTVHGGGRATRCAASVMVGVLSVSLVISLQPCCKLFTSLVEPHGHESTAMLHGPDHEHGSTAPASGKVQDSCTHGINSGAELAKVVPAIPGRTPSSPDGAVFAVLSLPVFTAARHLASPAVYHPSPPPFRRYLRFLHLLI